VASHPRCAVAEQHGTLADRRESLARYTVNPLPQPLRAIGLGRALRLGIAALLRRCRVLPMPDTNASDDFHVSLPHDTNVVIPYDIIEISVFFF
jgi:hypothetical protein